MDTKKIEQAKNWINTGIAYEKNRKFENAYASYRHAQDILLSFGWSEPEAEPRCPKSFWECACKDTEKQGYLDEAESNILAEVLGFGEIGIGRIAVLNVTDSTYFAALIKNPKQTKDGRLAKPIQAVMGDQGKNRTKLVKLSDGGQLQFMDPNKLYYWLMAHLGNSGIEMTLDIYRVDNGNMVYSEKIWEHTRLFRYQFSQAIVANPEYAWAYAHLGEMYRNIANSFFSFASTGTEKRNNYYMVSYVLFEIATELKQDYTWANAHFSASIVNARAFRKNVTNFGISDSDGPSDPEQNPDGPLVLLERAKEHLETALDATGAYYPWAFVYYSGALLLETVFKEQGLPEQKQNAAESGDADFLHVVTTLSTGLRQDPRIIRNAFEPGMLTSSAELAAAELRFAAKQYSEAWAHGIKGLNTIFKTTYIPLLAQAIVYSYLYYIARQVAENPDDVADSSNLEWESNSMFSHVPLPIEPPQFKSFTGRNREATLEQFRIDILHKVIHPAAAPYETTVEYTIWPPCHDREAWPAKVNAGLMVLCALVKFLDKFAPGEVTTEHNCQAFVTSLAENWGLSLDDASKLSDDPNLFFFELINTETLASTRA